MSWIDYNRTGEVVEVNIRDFSGRKIDSFKCNNNKDFQKILGVLRDKYGFEKIKPSISAEESINELNKQKKKPEWFDNNSNWNV